MPRSSIPCCRRYKDRGADGWLHVMGEEDRRGRSRWLRSTPRHADPLHRHRHGREPSPENKHRHHRRHHGHLLDGLQRRMMTPMAASLDPSLTIAAARPRLAAPPPSSAVAAGGLCRGTVLQRGRQRHSRFSCRAGSAASEIS
ncbi:uncharacterized protein [Triticum aestivum]|uniref:uncharacterized protein isoform X2 n=2 Tax=Triticum aestivum TaxID=4565 RepID=UPI001D02379E|nr:uncharacterized protein LOC123089748 isoform X2 [Triticum aestivum]